MAVVRLEVMRALRAAIECAIPELEGKICAGQSPPDRDRPALSLSIQPGRWTYEPTDAEPTYEPSADKLVVQVGEHEAPVKLTLTAPTLGQRYEVEQKLIDLFLGQALRPGVLVTPVTSCPLLGDFIAAWSLDTDEWEDELALERKFASILILTAQIPALVTRCGVYRIRDLRLGLADLAPAGGVAYPNIETVSIAVDGTITPIPPT